MLVDLSYLLGMLKRRGLHGVAIIEQGPLKTPYVAAAIDRDGRICNPRSWRCHATPEAAVNDLLSCIGPLPKQTQLLVEELKTRD